MPPKKDLPRRGTNLKLQPVPEHEAFGRVGQIPKTGSRGTLSKLSPADERQLLPSPLATKSGKTSAESTCVVVNDLQGPTPSSKWKNRVLRSRVLAKDPLATPFCSCYNCWAQSFSRKMGSRGEIGRHKGLKIPRRQRAVPVQVWPGAPD